MVIVKMFTIMSDMSCKRIDEREMKTSGEIYTGHRGL